MADKKTDVKAKKDKAPRKRGRFFKEFVGEVKKLTWLSWKDLMVNSLTVFAFVVIFAVLIGLLDYAFGSGFDFLAGIANGG